MEKLTNKNPCHSCGYGDEEIPMEGLACEECTKYDNWIAACFRRLQAYESTGCAPEQVKRLIDERIRKGAWKEASAKND